MKNLLTLLPALFLPTLLHAEILFTEPFAYPDGPLVELAPDVWQNHSGAEAQTQILDNALLLSGTASEDINRAFSPVGLTSGIVHVAFDLITTRLPSAAGSYFFHFKDANSGPSSLFLGRLFASTTDATPGHFRISIAWGTGTPISIPRDLPTNSLHRIVLTLDLDQTNAVVRIDPLDEHSPVDSATSTDLRNAGVGMSRVAFRQATGIGNHQIRNLVVGTRFLDVTGTATPEVVLLSADLGPDRTPRLTFPSSLLNSGYRLEASDRPESGWESGPQPVIYNDLAVIPIEPSAPHRFYRLHRW